MSGVYSQLNSPNLGMGHNFAYALLILTITTLTNASAQTADLSHHEIVQLVGDGAYDDAIKAIEHRLSSGVHKENVRLLSTYTEALLAKGEWEKTSAAYKRTIRFSDSLGMRSMADSARVDLLAFLRIIDRADEARRLARHYLSSNRMKGKELAEVQRSFGSSLGDIGQSDSALFYHLAANEYFAKTKDSIALIPSYNDLAQVYRTRGNFEKAIETMLAGYPIVIAKGNEYLKCRYEHTLSDLYTGQHNLILAHDYAMRSFERAERIGATAHMAISAHSIGDVHLKQKDYAKAIRWFRKSILPTKTKQLKKVTLVSQAGMSKAFLALNMLDSAENCLVACREIVGAVSNPYFLDNYLFAEAHFALTVGAIDEADSWVKRLAESGLAGTVRSRLQLVQLQYRIARKKGEHKQALSFLKEVELLKDSLFRTEQERVVVEMDKRFERSVKEQQIASMNADKQIQDLQIAQKDFQLKAGTIGVGALALLGVFMLLQWRTIRKINDQLKRKGEQISTALGEKELLLKEIHHRVKNNLQVISSLLSLQSREIEDDAALEAVTNSRNRVKCMALIHQDLYKEDNLTGININDYVSKLCKSLVSNYKVDSGRVDVETDVDELMLDVDTTIPLGLILNELLANALKYAFPNGREGKVKVSLNEIGGELRLVVQDDGVGLGDNPGGSEDSTGFGTKMIKTFCKKLDADHAIRNENGTVVEMRIRKYKRAS